MRIAALLLLLAPASALANKPLSRTAPSRPNAPAAALSSRLPAFPQTGMRALVESALIPTVSVKLRTIDPLGPGIESLLPSAQAQLLRTPEELVAAEIAKAPVLQALKAAQQRSAEKASPRAGLSNAWGQGAQSFDGASGGAAFVDPYSGRYRRLGYNEEAKVRATLRYASQGSQTFAALNDEFERKGGYYLIDSSRGADYMAAAAVDRQNRPVIVLTDDLLNRDNLNGKWGDEYRGAPWEFIASVIAREQVFFNGWYSVIPASAEKLAISFMNMARVFVELTNGTTRSWATDKDYKTSARANQGDVIVWPWFEQLVHAARAAYRGAGTNSGHIIDSKFVSRARDWVAVNQKSGVAGFAYTLWEQLTGDYYRPGDAKNGQALPPGAPRIDQAAYDRAAYTAYGADGKARDQNGNLDVQTVLGWIIDWLRNRREI